MLLKNMLNKEELNLWIKKQKQTFAKTYATTYPHYYIKRNDCDAELFEQFLIYVRQDGIVKQFHKKQYIYLEIDGYEYWEMGRPIRAAIILNVAPIDDSASYRQPPVPLEQALILKQKLLQRDVYLSCLLDKPNPTIEELQSIEFLMNTRRRIDGGGKNIIDHYTQPIRYI